MNTMEKGDSDHTYDIGRVRKEALEFRKIMTNNRNSIDYIDRALGCLFLIICRAEKQCDEEAKRIWDTLTTEWRMRKVMMIWNGHPLEDPTNDIREPA